MRILVRMNDEMFLHKMQIVKYIVYLRKNVTLLLVMLMIGYNIQLVFAWINVNDEVTR